MTKNNIKFLSYFLLFSILFFNCNVDYDIEEVAPQEHLTSEHNHDHTDEDACPECDSEHNHDHTDEEEGPDFAPPLTESENTDITEQVEDSHAGHNHAAGARNHGTQWFFNQPWAAPFIWPKLLRDALIFLVLAVVLFIITARKGKK